MVESAFATHPDGDDREALLATKLHAPSVPAGLVPRPRLARRPDACLVLVCAPAGYGKTTLLTEWARQRPSCGWLSLDTGDNDPARFWRHVIATLDTVRSGIAERLAGLLGPPAPPSFEGVVTALINELDPTPASHVGPGASLAAGESVDLILDDYHAISSPRVHETVAFLVDHAPASLRLMLATRSDPPLPLARLRARGQLAEVRVAGLRFTPDEAALLLRDASGVELSDRAAAALTERTEGWAVGLRLAGLSLRGGVDVDRFVMAFGGSHRFVLDYLVEEVLQRQSDPVRTFVLETSVLQRFNADVCDAVTGRTGSQAMLERVEGAGLFVIPLDDVRGWWRYHHLFADLLQARLAQQLPERPAQLHRAAAEWFETRGLPDESIHHALAAGDPAWAARLIERHFDDVFNLRGEQETIHRWLPNIPDPVVTSRPRLLLARAQMASMRGDTQAAAPLVEAAERAWATTSHLAAGEAFEPTVGRAASLLINVPAMIALQRSYHAQLRGDAEPAQRYAETALDEIASGESMLMTTAQSFLAVASWMHGDLVAAERQFVDNIASWRAAGQTTATAWGDYCLAQLQRAQGRLDASAHTCRRALDLAGAPAQPAPATAPAHTGLAQVAYQRNELDVALTHLEKAITAGRRFVHSPPLAAALMTLAWVYQAQGEPDRARETMTEAARIAPGPDGLFNPVPAQQARLLLVQGDVAEADRWVREQGLNADDELDYGHETGHLVLARVLLARQRPEHALLLLDRLHTAARGAHRGQTVIEAGALRAVALWQADRRPEACDALTDALTIAHPQRYLRVFADEGTPMAALLRDVFVAGHGRPALPVPLGYLAELRHAFDAGSPAPQTIVPQGMLEPLTRREIEVLSLLTRGASNQTIAASLVVTLDTVKKHVSHVLRKLEAKNRTEAVARARELHIFGSSTGLSGLR
jgi:LuxR family maltose regulon positive regulatory protein